MARENCNRRELWIDIVKILGILFVMLNHLDVKIPLISQFGGMFYVPVFFVLAGYTLRPEKEAYPEFILRKAKRLLAPYFVYSALFLLFFTVKDGFRAEALLGIAYARNCLYPLGTADNRIFMDIANSPMWFLPALFLTEVYLEGFLRGGEKVFWVRITSCTVIGLFAVRLCPILLPWSLEAVPLFGGLMAAGYGMREKNALESYSGSGWFLALLAIVLAWIYKNNGPINISVADFGNYEAQGFLTALLSSVLAMSLCYRLCGENTGISAGWRRAAEAVADSTLDIMCAHMFLFIICQGGLKAFFPSLWAVWEDGGILSGMLRFLAVLGVTAVTVGARKCIRNAVCRPAAR